MFGKSGTDGKHIDIKYDIGGNESSLLRQQAVSPLADPDLPVVRCSLAFLVESHHDSCRSQPAQFPGMGKKDFLTFFERDRIDNAFSLGIFQPCKDCVPVGRIDHKGGTSHGGISGDIPEKCLHLGRRFKHGVIHVDIDHGRPPFYLSGSNSERLVIRPGSDQAGKFPGTGHIRPLPDVHKKILLPVYRHGFEATDMEAAVRLGKRSGRYSLDGIRESPDMGGRRAAAPPYDIDESFLRHQADRFRHLGG